MSWRNRHPFSRREHDDGTSSPTPKPPPASRTSSPVHRQSSTPALRRRGILPATCHPPPSSPLQLCLPHRIHTVPALALAPTHLTTLPVPPPTLAHLPPTPLAPPPAPTNTSPSSVAAPAPTTGSPSSPAAQRPRPSGEPGAQCTAPPTPRSSPRIRRGRSSSRWAGRH